MSDVIIPTRFRLRRDTAANWTANNPTPLSGEPCLETDTGFRKTGDGVTTWDALDYDDASRLPFDGNSSNGLSAGNVQEAINELADKKLNDAPSDGNTYGRKNGAWSVVGGGAGMTLVGSATVAGAAATTMTVTGLDLASDGAYLILLNIGNSSASNATISMFYNGDTTPTNYYFQFWSASGGGSSASRTNTAAIASVNASTSASGAIELLPDVLNGYPRSTIRLNRFAPASMELLHSAHVHNNGANVTSITISSSVANALAVGSYVKVYRLG